METLLYVILNYNINGKYTTFSAKNRITAYEYLPIYNKYARNPKCYAKIITKRTLLL